MEELRKELRADGLLARIRKSFIKIPDPSKRASEYSLPDCLMSGLALFGLKHASLLDFDKKRGDKFIQHNLNALYKVEKVPCDTSLRERLDLVNPVHLSQTFGEVFSALQRGKVLEDYPFYEGHYLIPLDGTGFFSSPDIHCESCCQKEHRDGSITYHHQMLSAVLVHPNHKEVFPFAPEAMIKQDGSKKNDCERNAAKRLLPRIRREHPHLKMIIVGDALYGNAPFILMLKDLKMKYILGVKPDDHKYLFEFFKAAKKITHEWVDAYGIKHHYEFKNDLPLNSAHPDVSVNMIDYTETKPNGKIQHFTWITDFVVTTDNVSLLVKGGRARWKIENETFNTLKNQGYYFEHNFGHGHEHLSTVFAHLMMLAFFIDQVQQRCCPLFQAALNKKERKCYLWDCMRSLATHYFVDSWQDLFNSIAYDYKGHRLTPNTT